LRDGLKHIISSPLRGEDKGGGERKKKILKTLIFLEFSIQEGRLIG